jgi:hypothetical protein
MLKYNTNQFHISSYFNTSSSIPLFILHYISAYTDDGGFGGFFASFIIFTSTRCSFYSFRYIRYDIFNYSYLHLVLIISALGRTRAYTKLWFTSLSKIPVLEAEFATVWLNKLAFNLCKYNFF